MADALAIPDVRAPRVWLAVVWSLFQLWTAYQGMFDLLIQLPAHVAFATALGLLTPGGPGGRTRWWDVVGAVLALACAGHYVAWIDHLSVRMPMVDTPRPLDVAVAVLFALLLLEASRRHVGGALVVLALAFVVYAFVGPWMPGFLATAA